MEIKYLVDFDPALSEIITETKYMEQLGFSVPELARNVALQEDKYIKYLDGLKHMLNSYHSVLASLDNAEVSDFSTKCLPLIDHTLASDLVLRTKENMQQVAWDIALPDAFF